MTIETLIQTDALRDMAAIYAVTFGLFTPGALMAARQFAPAPVPTPQNAPSSNR